MRHLRVRIRATGCPQPCAAVVRRIDVKPTRVIKSTSRVSLPMLSVQKLLCSPAQFLCESYMSPAHAVPRFKRTLTVGRGVGCTSGAVRPASLAALLHSQQSTPRSACQLTVRCSAARLCTFASSFRCRRSSGCNFCSHVRLCLDCCAMSIPLEVAACVPRHRSVAYDTVVCQAATLRVRAATWALEPSGCGKIGGPSIVGGQTVEEQTRRVTVCDTPERRYHGTRGHLEHGQRVRRGRLWEGGTVWQVARPIRGLPRAR
jgi:hypothetical protein